MSKSLTPNYRARRFVALLITAIITLSGAAIELYRQEQAQVVEPTPVAQKSTNTETALAIDALAQLDVKGRAPKTDYARSQFGDGWQVGVTGCNTRNVILQRDLRDVVVNEKCHVISGTLLDPYTGKQIEFVRGQGTSDKVQIDHVVALSNAWQTGAQLLAPERRAELSNDPLNLLAVEGSVNQQKGDADTATWLPPNKPYRCAYVARQISVKQRYELWVTPAEKEAMARVLSGCDAQPILQ